MLFVDAGIEILPHLCESHELSSSVNTISVCCCELDPAKKVFSHEILCRFGIHNESFTIISSVRFVSHHDALHEIRVNDLTIGRRKESC